MNSVPLAAFAPDVASVDAAATSVATNVVPRADGYGPMRGAEAITGALPNKCRGAISVQSPQFGYTTYFAGTRNGLYKLNLSNYGWKDITPSDVSFGLDDNDYWSFTLYGNRLVATPQNGPTLVINVDTGARFKPLAGSPPRARFNGIVGEFLVLGALANDRNAIQWSDLGDIERWTPGAPGQYGDGQPFPDGGAVTGFAGGEFGLVFQERAVRRMVFTGGAGVFDFSVIDQNRGCVSPSALVSIGAQTFFLDRDGFYATSGGPSQPIGAERVNRYFLERVNPTFLTATLAVRDNTGPRVMFAYRSKDETRDGVLDEALLYDWRLDRWTSLALSMRYALPVATPSASLDALTGSIETHTMSFDDPSYQGGIPSFGVVTTDNTVARLTGDTLEAQMATAPAMLARPNGGFLRGVRLDSDADDWRVTVSTRQSLARSATVYQRPEASPNRAQFAPMRAAGRYHTVALRIPAGTDWTYAKAIEPDATAEGLH